MGLRWHHHCSSPYLPYLPHSTWKRGSLLRYRWLIALGALGPSAGTAILYISGWTSDDPLLAGVSRTRPVWDERRLRRSLGRTALSHQTFPHARLRRRRLRHIVWFLPNRSESNPTCSAHVSPHPPSDLGGILLALRHDLMSSVGARSIMDMASTPPLRAGKPPLRLFLGTGLFGAIFVATNHLSETKTEVSTELFTLIAGIGISIALVLIAINQGHARELLATVPAHHSSCHRMPPSHACPPAGSTVLRGTRDRTNLGIFPHLHLDAVGSHARATRCEAPAYSRSDRSV